MTVSSLSPQPINPDAEFDCPESSSREAEGRSILSWARELIDLFGDRPAGTERCRNAAQRIASDLRLNCHRVELQKFYCHPWAFIWHGWVVVFCIIVASALLFFGQWKGAELVYFLATIVALAQFGFYRELLDPLFPRKQCANVVGILEPRRKAARQIILSSHHDSAFEFRYLRFSRILHGVTLLGYGFASMAMPWVIGAMKIGNEYLDLPVGEGIWKAMAVFAAVSGMLFLGLFSRRSVPGAGDNLVSSGILVHISRVIRERLQHDADALQDTRIIFASFDAEESGLRGSRSFLRDNSQLMGSVPSCNINLESLYQLKDLSFLVNDRNGMVRLSSRMGELLKEAAEEESVSVAPMRMWYGLGSTDAAEFAKLGIPATTLLAVPHRIFSTEKILYHSRDDIPENIDARVVGVATRIVLRVINRLVEGKPSEAKLLSSAPTAQELAG